MPARRVWIPFEGSLPLVFPDDRYGGAYTEAEYTAWVGGPEPCPAVAFGEPTCSEPRAQGTTQEEAVERLREVLERCWRVPDGLPFRGRVPVELRRGPASSQEWVAFVPLGVCACNVNADDLTSWMMLEVHTGPLGRGQTLELARDDLVRWLREAKWLRDGRRRPKSPTAG